MAAQKILQLMEQLLLSAHTGKNYASDAYNQARYTDMIGLLEELYEEIPGFNRLTFPNVEGIGYITPKVGVNGIIENENGAILLEKRMDDKAWCIIGGWCEPGMSPEENLIKEIKEETGFLSEVVNLVGIWSRIPNENYPFSSYHLVYHCKITGGDLEISHESEDVAFIHPDQVKPWHYDHEDWVRYYLKNKSAAD